MKIAIRIDDITECMDWPKFLRFKAILDAHSIKPLIGVIPQNMDDTLKGDSDGAPSDFWNYISSLKAEGYTIAMHGSQHIYTTKKGGLFPLNNFSEFAGLSYEKQLSLLNKGTALLKKNGIETDIFMAPAHSYDKNTLKALKALNFNKITDGLGKVPYSLGDFTFYPISFNRKSVLNASTKNGYTTFVYHINTMNDKDFESFENLLSNYEIISFNELLKLSPKKATCLKRIGEFLLATLKRMLIAIKSR